LEDAMKIDKHPKSMALIAVAVGIFVIGVILTIAFWDRDALLGVGITMAVIGIGIVLLGCINLQAQSGSGTGLTGQTDGTADNGPAGGPAPKRVPPRHEFTLRDGTFVDGGDDEEDADGLVYDEFSASPSPPRAVRLADGTVIGNDDGEFSPVSGTHGIGGGATAAGGARSGSVVGIVPNGTAFVSVTPVGDSAALRAAAVRRDGGPLFPLSPFEQRSFPVPEVANPHANAAASKYAAGVASPEGRHSQPYSNGYGSPGGMGSDAENTPPPPPFSSSHMRRGSGTGSRPLDPATAVGPRLPANSNTPYTTTTTTTVSGSGMRHRTSTRPLPADAAVDSPPPPRREMPTGYEPSAHGFTPQQLDAEIARHRDVRYEAHLAAVDAMHDSFATPQGDEDALPGDYWKTRGPPGSGAARSVKFE
jgi:hypothetical protein